MTIDEWKAEQARIVATVACPRCKAAIGEPCVWGSTNSGNVHTPRMDRYAKAAAK